MKTRLAFAELDDLECAAYVLPPIAPVPSFKDMDSARTPVADMAPAVTEPLGTLDHSSKLVRLTGKALDRADEILEALPDFGSDNYGEDMRAVTSTLKTVLTTQLRVDESHLRRRAIDTLPELLKLVMNEEKALSARTINP